MFWWKAERRNQFCSSVTWQLTTETGMTPQASHFLVPFKPRLDVAFQFGFFSQSPMLRYTALNNCTKRGGLKHMWAQSHFAAKSRKKCGLCSTVRLVFWMLGLCVSARSQSVAAGPGCISWAMHHVKKALTGAFQFAFVRLPSLLQCPRYRRMESASPNVSEWMRERKRRRERERLCVSACVRPKDTERVSKWVMSFTTTSFQRSNHHRSLSCLILCPLCRAFLE